MISSNTVEYGQRVITMTPLVGDMAE